ncbi:MAG: sulfocyanin-like copper-binding protein [Mycobacterium sp.]|nr:sulfocyanin-like copper-binding protein [Mycobacterium sp.]
MNHNRLRTGLLIGAAALALGIGTTAVMAGAGAGPGFAPMAGPPGYGGPLPAQPAPCTPPALPGAVVDVTTSDMGAMMGPGMNGPGMNGGPMMGPGMMGPGMNGGPMMGPQGAWPNSPGMGMGMMRLTINPTSVPAGQVSLRVANNGWLPHEVVVMPLGPGQNPGQRPVGANWEVNETGSLGEAAHTCGAGEGDGIAPGTMGWTTLTLQPGRYELLCNIAGHYGSGMYAELDVTPAR